jgi:putative transposase
MKTRPSYPTDLSDQEWTLIKHGVPEARPGGRPEAYPKREVLNAICYRLRRGCSWRMLPHDLPPLAARVSLLPPMAPGWPLAGDP